MYTRNVASINEQIKYYHVMDRKLEHQKAINIDKLKETRNADSINKEEMIKLK